MGKTQERVLPGRGALGTTKAVSRKKRSPAEVLAARKRASEKEPGCLFWFPSRIYGPDSVPHLDDDPFAPGGTTTKALYPRILRGGKPLKIKGQIRLGELPGDRGIAIKLIMTEARAHFDQSEIIKKKLLTEADFAMIENGKHPDENKSTPNEEPAMCLPDIDMLTDQEADTFCKDKGLLVPAGAGLLEKRAHIKKVLGLTQPPA